MAVPSGQTVAGVGCVRGQLNLLTAGARVHPGVYTLPGPITAPGILTVTNGLTLANGGTYLWDMKTLKDDATGVAGTDFARLDVPLGAASLSGGVLTLGFVGTAADNGPNSTNQFWRTVHTWTILTAASSPTGKLSISNGNMSILWDSSVAKVLLALAIMVIVVPPVLRLLRRRQRKPEPDIG